MPATVKLLRFPFKPDAQAVLRQLISSPRIGCPSQVCLPSVNGLFFDSAGSLVDEGGSLLFGSSAKSGVTIDLVRVLRSYASKMCERAFVQRNDRVSGACVRRNVAMEFPPIIRDSVRERALVRGKAEASSFDFNLQTW
jgi:hypothetical protein